MNLFFNTGLSCIPEVFIRCKVWGLKEPGTGGREFLIQLIVDGFKKISIFGANNSLGLRKQSSQKSNLLRLLAKSLKNTCE